MLFTTNEGAVENVLADGMPYFPLFAGKDAKFASMKTWPFVETLVNGKITEQKD